MPYGNYCMPQMNYGMMNCNNIFSMGCMRPQMYYGFNPCNNIFYQMNMMNNMFMLGQATGNSLMSIFGLGQPSYYQPAFGTITRPQTGMERTQQKAKAIDWSKLNPFKKLTAKNKAKKSAQAEERKAMVSDKNNLPRLNQVGYDNQKGVSLAQDAAVHAKKRSQKYCAKYVKKAIEREGLGSYESGHAYQCADILAQNNNFKEIKVTKGEFAKLPAGCVVVYPKGDAGYSQKYGHIEVAMGNGKGVSDFINQNMKYSPNARVFVPVVA